MNRLARLALPMTAALAVSGAVPSFIPSAPRPSISAADVAVVEGDDAIIILNLSEPAPDYIQVAYRTRNRTATGGSDFAENDSFTQFYQGQSTTIITVPTFDDGEVEGDEVFVVHLHARGASTPAAR